MTELTHEELKKLYANRRKKLTDYLIREKVGAAVFIDNESHREPAIRYFTGHTSDAVFIIYETGKSVLIPWDEILAKKSGAEGANVSTSNVTVEVDTQGLTDAMQSSIESMKYELAKTNQAFADSQALKVFAENFPIMILNVFIFVILHSFLWFYFVKESIFC